MTTCNATIHTGWRWWTWQACERLAGHDGEHERMSDYWRLHGGICDCCGGHWDNGVAHHYCHIHLVFSDDPRDQALAADRLTQARARIAARGGN